LFPASTGHSLPRFAGPGFGNRRLADTRLADKNRIVFLAGARAPADAFDFGFTADNRVELAAARQFGQVATKMIQRRCLGFFAFLLERRRLPF